MQEGVASPVVGTTSTYPAVAKIATATTTRTRFAAVSEQRATSRGKATQIPSLSRDPIKFPPNARREEDTYPIMVFCTRLSKGTHPPIGGIDLNRLIVRQSLQGTTTGRSGGGRLYGPITARDEFLVDM